MITPELKIVKNKQRTMSTKLVTFKPSISVDAAKKIGAVGHDLETLICELIDNPIPNEKPKTPIRVDVRINYDGDNSFIQILDNSIGIPIHSIADAFNYGKSVNAGKLRLSRMGMGMKVVLFALGELDYIITKTKNNPAYILRINDYTDAREDLEFVLDEYTGIDFPQYESGTLIKIKNCSEMIRNWTDKKDFDKFCSKIESTYPQLLNEFLNISINYTKPNNTLWSHECIAYKPLMSNPERIINTTNGLGENSPILDKLQLVVEGYPDVRAYLTCWHKPHPLTVTETFNNTKDALYDPKKYANSPWSYGDEFSGIALGMRGKILEWNLDKKSSRNERHGILLEVEEGLDYTALKSGVKKTKRYKQIIKAVNDKLDEIDFYERSTSLTPAISENKYMDKFFERLKNDDTTKRAYGVKDFDKQVKIRPLCGVGAPDGVIYDYLDENKPIWIIEGKKDKGAGDEAGQLVRYMAHYKCHNGIFVSPVKNPQFDQQIKDFNEFFGINIAISNIDIAWVNSLQFFAI
jgi:hypothetical protein